MLRKLELADMDVAAQVHRLAFDEALPWLTGRHTPQEDRWFFRKLAAVGRSWRQATLTTNRPSICCFLTRRYSSCSSEPVQFSHSHGPATPDPKSASYAQ